MPCLLKFWTLQRDTSFHTQEPTRTADSKEPFLNFSFQLLSCVLMLWAIILKHIISIRLYQFTDVWTCLFAWQAMSVIRHRNCNFFVAVVWSICNSMLSFSSDLRYEIFKILERWISCFHCKNNQRIRSHMQHWLGQKVRYDDKAKRWSLAININNDGNERLYRLWWW